MLNLFLVLFNNWRSLYPEQFIIVPLPHAALHTNILDLLLIMLCICLILMMLWLLNLLARHIGVVFQLLENIILIYFLLCCLQLIFHFINTRIKPFTLLFNLVLQWSFLLFKVPIISRLLYNFRRLWSLFHRYELHFLIIIFIDRCYKISLW